MSHSTRLSDSRTPHYSLETRGALAVLNFTGDIYELGTWQEAKETMLSLFSTLEDDARIRAVLILNAPGVLGGEAYIRFITRSLEARAGGREFPGPSGLNAAASLQIEQMGNALNQLMRVFVNFGKLLMVGYEGAVASPFFGAGLAADYRFGTPDMAFEPSHIQLGITPGGGLGFFLPQMVGRTQTRDLLFADEPTSALDLQGLGLLDEVYPADDFETACVNKATELASLPLAAIQGVKAITNAHAKHLADFLEYEEMTTDRALAGRLCERMVW